MDKLKYIKLENEDGSYSSSIPLAVDSDYVDVNGNTLTNELANKATKIEVQAVASGSPAGVYTTFSALTTADPDHSKIYLVTADGHWYYYNSGWQDGGIYQATSISENYNYLVEIRNSIVESGYANYNNGQLVANEQYARIKIPVIPGLKFKYSPAHTDGNPGVCFYNSSTCNSTTFISGYQGTTTDIIVTVPENAVSAIFSWNIDYATENNVASFLGSIFDYQQAISENKNNIITLLPIKDIIDLEISKIENAYIKASNAAILSNNTYDTLVVKVVEGMKFLYNSGGNQSITGVSFFSGEQISSKTLISSIVGTTTNLEIEIPKGCILATFSYSKNNITEDKVLNFKGTMGDIINKINSVEEIVMPSKSIVKVGIEWNLYFNNLFYNYNMANHYIATSISPSIPAERCKQFEKYLRINANASDVGEKVLTILLKDKSTDKVLNYKTINLNIINSNLNATKNVVFIGDSLMQNGIIPCQITKILNSNIVSIGTRNREVTLDDVTYSVKTEGRSGWASYDYTRTVEDYKTDVANPFWNSSTNEFDFSYYITQNNFSNINCVVIGLGTNGWSRLEKTIEALDIMIASIHNYNSNIKILISLPTPPATQDGCGYNNGLQSSYQLKYQQLNLIKKYIEKYEEKTNIDVAELYFNLDSENDFDETVVTCSNRNPKQITVQTNNVHPSFYGYLKMADVYYNCIENILS